MILSKTAKYGLRMCAYLALQGTDSPFRASDLAAGANIPVYYSGKILRLLVQRGLLVGTKGHGGGFVLARPLNRIRFIDVIEAIEGEVKQKECVFGLKECSDTKPCILHHNWKDLNEAFQSWARKTSLLDVRNNSGQTVIMERFLEARR